MTRDEIIKLAREAGLKDLGGANMAALERFAALVEAAERKAIESALTDPENQPSQWGTVTIEHMEQQVAAEREACAKVCELIDTSAFGTDERPAPNDCAAAIRARSKE